MSLTVLQPGPMVTVQDAGRFGLRDSGVSAAGPMDAPAHRLANALVGNPTGAAALEFAGMGGRFRVETGCRVALTGVTAPLEIDGQACAANAAHRADAGAEIRIGAASDGVWGYLALSGGIETAPLMGARATHLRAGLGRALEAGDSLPLGATDPQAPCLALGGPLPDESGPIRVVLGPQDDRFSDEIRARLSDAEFTVSSKRDRMAMVLDDVTLPAEHGHDIVSDGTVPGSIQVPASGQPIVLMAESQTTGGYAKIATVIGPDLPRLAQMATGTQFRFAVLTRDEAEEALIAARSAEAERLAALRPQAATRLTSEFLLSCDLVGGVWPGDEVVP
ncbi:allophanate hydrolase [Tranquillimonas rosea]|uniref:Allophanate hydrolase n=1 Tax=Tranquillimonas rosea TaxID=641238 RepID=A0A1H9WIZ8_9RHOB|nr:biotin-dependent carboxyltransferase family protein [Tranquillimonas rosea]SES33657.1 allophanate hydrolase [Tranquillimonas rosea]